MTTGFAALIALAAIAVTYFSCVRPMLRGRGQNESGPPALDVDPDRQVAELREELRVLRAQDALDRSRATDA